MHKAHYVNRALFVVSDGGENHSVHDSQELSRAFADSPVPIFLLMTINPWLRTLLKK